MYRHAFGLIASVFVAVSTGIAAPPARAADCDKDCRIRSHQATSRDPRAPRASTGAPWIKMTPAIHHAAMPYQVVHTPAVTGFVTRDVEVKSAQAHYVDVPAVYGTVARHDGANIGHHHHHRCFDRHHDKALITPTVAQRVLLQAPGRVLHVTPAVHRTVERSVIMRPAARRVVVPVPPTGDDYGFIAGHRERSGWGWYRPSR